MTSIQGRVLEEGGREEKMGGKNDKTKPSKKLHKGRREKVKGRTDAVTIETLFVKGVLSCLHNRPLLSPTKDDKVMNVTSGQCH